MPSSVRPFAVQQRVWVAIHESGSYSSYQQTIIGVYATRAAAKRALIAWAEKQVDDDVADTRERYPEGIRPNGSPADPDDVRSYRRHQYGLDDYRWFDSAEGSRWAPTKPPVRLTDGKGRVNADLSAIDFRDDWLKVRRFEVEE